MSCLLVLSLMGVERWRQELSRDHHRGFVLSRNGLGGWGGGGGSKTDLAYTHTPFFSLLVEMDGWMDVGMEMHHRCIDRDRISLPVLYIRSTSVVRIDCGSDSVLFS